MNRQKLTFIILTAVLLVGLVVLAASLSQVELSPGQTFNWSSLLNGREGFGAATSDLGNDNTGSPSIIIMILFWVGLLAAIIYAFVSPQYRQRALGALFVVALFLFFRFVIGQRLTELQGVTEQEIPFSADLSESPPLPEPPAFITDPPDWIIWIVALLAAFLLLTLGIYIWRQRQQSKAQPDQKQLFVQEAEQALQELDAGGNLKDVVLRCYAQMEGVMRQSQAIERQQSMTPREFEAHLLKAGFSDDHISRLVRLFEEVRYGARPSHGRIEQEARDCLTAIVTSYGQPDPENLAASNLIYKTTNA